MRLTSSVEKFTVQSLPPAKHLLSIYRRASVPGSRAASWVWEQMSWELRATSAQAGLHSPGCAASKLGAEDGSIDSPRRSERMLQVQPGAAQKTKAHVRSKVQPGKRQS